MKLSLLIGVMFFSSNVAGAISSEQLQPIAINISNLHINPTEKLLLSWMEESENFRQLQRKLNNDYLRLGKSEKMVKNIFYRTHKMVFSEYSPFSTDKEAMGSGKFDCVSGSLVLAGLLDHYGIPFEVYETSYHVFLSVNLEGKPILLEVTDPFSGFITNEQEIAQFFEGIKNSSNAINPGGIVSEELVTVLEPEVFEKIKLSNLVGLQYFNQAIKHFNEENFLVAYQFATSAIKYHDTERIRDFAAYLESRIALLARF
jgi:hypothetical protein